MLEDLNMAMTVQREAQPVAKDDFLTGSGGLPERVEFVQGVVGPYTDTGKLTLLANWGADEVLRLTGPEVWRAALAAHDVPAS
jgi:hypothetical protein